MVEEFSSLPLPEQILAVAIVILTIIPSVFSFLYLFFTFIKEAKDEKKEKEAYSRRIKEAIIPKEIKKVEQSDLLSIKRDIPKEDFDVIGRIGFNLENINDFYTWSQKQAKASFILAVAMCFLGFLLIASAVVLPVFLRLSFELSIIPAVGGIITELIAGTALVVYRNSLLQLNHYHRALHEDQRFLSSVELLGKFISRKRKIKCCKKL